MAGPFELILPPPANKGKQAVGQLSLAPNNELLNAAEMTPRFAAASVAEMLREKMFGGVYDVSEPCFLTLTSHMACSTKQQVAFR